MLLNIRNKDFFKFKFKREPKNWDIESLHELSLKTKLRKEKRNQERSNFIFSIKDQLQPDDKGCYRIYYNFPKYFSDKPSDTYDIRVLLIRFDAGKFKNSWSIQFDRLSP
jgi:hypothetical protein